MLTCHATGRFHSITSTSIYDSLWDLPEYDPDRDAGPHATGRAQMNRISIVTSNVAATTLAQAALEQGDRAA